MSVKGFIINGSTVKYDYDALDNKPTIPSGGGGVSDDLKEALLQLAEKIAYVDANGADYYQDLYDALYGSTPAPTRYTITNNLTDVTNSNSATSITEGGSYSATLTPTSGYTINSVSITMGGTDVTGTSYSGGTISIANVTGNIVITAVATERQATLLSISAVFTQGQNVIYDTDTLNSLKQYLVVTANWDDSTTSTVAAEDYTLSGTLSVGTSTITVSYGGKTATFNVTVSEANVVYVNNGDIVLDGSTMIDTGYSPSTGTFTVMCEWSSWTYERDTALFSLYSANAGNNNPVVALFYAWYSQNPVGLSMNYGNEMTDIAVNKAVCTQQNGGKPRWYYKDTNGQLITLTMSNNGLIGTSNIWIGGKVTSDDGSTYTGCATGTITILKAYNVVCSEAKIKEFLGVE